MLQGRIFFFVIPLSLSYVPRQDIHHDWQRQLHSESRHCALRHFLALQAHQREKGEDWHAVLSPRVCCGNLWERRRAEGPAVRSVNRQPAGGPVTGNPSEGGSHLRHSGERRSVSPVFLCWLSLSFPLCGLYGISLGIDLFLSVI